VIICRVINFKSMCKNDNFIRCIFALYLCMALRYGHSTLKATWLLRSLPPWALHMDFFKHTVSPEVNFYHFGPCFLFTWSIMLTFNFNTNTQHEGPNFGTYSKIWVLTYFKTKVSHVLRFKIARNIKSYWF